MVRVLILTRRGWSLAVIAAGLVAASTATAQDARQGKAVFASQCSVCHSDARNGPVILGPPLFGVVGRQAGSVAGFNYSPAMKAAGFAWTPDHLHSYLPAPRDYLPGVRMTYAGLKNPAQLDNLIAYLKTLK